MTGRPFLIAEFFVICVLLPTLIIVNVWAPYMFAFLWGVALYAFFALHEKHPDTYGDLWRWREVNLKNLGPILLRWLIACAALILFTMWYDPERLFALPRENPQILPGIMLFYPVLSALPQELIFCSFFFARYATLFGNGRLMVFMSALVFAYAHMLYINPVAPTVSFIGGLIFALTYRKTKSLALVTIEHGLYGNALFLIGLGWYFYSGGVAAP